MNTILLSFLCGAAFIGGAAAAIIIAALFWQMKDTKGRAEVREFWRQSIEKQHEQVHMLGDICEAIRNLRK